MKPATPLPWSLDVGDDEWTAGVTGNDKDGTAVVWVDFRTKESGIQFDDDAAYIVHAANAYPRLVAALRHSVEVLKNLDTVRHVAPDFPALDNADALLRELGEL